MAEQVTLAGAAGADGRVADIVTAFSRSAAIILGGFARSQPLGARAVAAELRALAAAAAEAERRVRRLEHGDGMPAPLLFDEDFPEDEQLPREITAVFREKRLNGVPSVVTLINGTAFGDRLTDTIHFAPGSRYHDVFHLAHAAHLGWSPVLRHLLGRKRVSDPRIAELEDCVRAQVVEEAIVSHIFNHLRRLDFQLATVSIDRDLLEQVGELSRGYEVEVLPTACWERAIRAAASIYTLLNENKGGTVIVDMLAGELDYLP
jgi:hypothetical protein